MVTTRRGRNTASAKPASTQSKKKQETAGNGPSTVSKSRKKRAPPESSQQPSAAADDTLKKQKVNSAVVAEDDPVAPKSPPETGDTTAMADIPTGADTAMTAADAEPTGTATAEPAAGATAGAAASEEHAPKATAGTGASASPDMPVSEAVKHIGGTKAGSSHVSQQPTAHKAIDAVAVGPDPAAAAAPTGPTAVGNAGAGTTGTGFSQPDDSNTDGDHYLDAALADSNMDDEGSKPAHQVPATTGTTDATKTGFLAPSAAQQTPPEQAPPAEGGAAAGHGIAAEAAAEPTDVPTGLHADTHAVGTGPSGADAMNSAAAVGIPIAPPTSAPTTASAHDSLFGGAAVQDSSDVPPMFGGDNA